MASQTASDTGAGAVASDTGGGDTSVAPSTATLPSDTTGLSGTTGGVASTGGGGRGAATGGGQALGGRTIAHSFSGVGIGWLLVGLAAAILLGVGSRRLIGDLVDSPAATCPLEVRR